MPRQPSSATRNDDHGRIGDVFEDLEAHRALTGDDERVVERMDERAPGLVEQRGKPLEGFALARRLPGRQRRRTLVASIFSARSLPHDDEAVDALQRRAVRKRLRVVPGRDPDHPRSPLVIGQGRELAQDSARLEAGALEELCFQVDARGPRDVDVNTGVRCRRPAMASRARLTSSGDGIGMLRSRARSTGDHGRVESALTAAARGHRSCGRS